MITFVKMYCTSEKNLTFSQNVKEIPCDTEFHSHKKIYIHIKSCTQIFIAKLFIIVSKWRQSKCSSIDTWMIQSNIIQHYKEIEY